MIKVVQSDRVTYLKIIAMQQLLDTNGVEKQKGMCCCTMLLL
jgi:hypothetical protein